MPKPMIDHEAQIVRPIIDEVAPPPRPNQWRARVGGYRSEPFDSLLDAKDWCDDMAIEGLLSEGEDPADWTVRPARVRRHPVHIYTVVEDEMFGARAWLVVRDDDHVVGYRRFLYPALEYVVEVMAEDERTRHLWEDC